MTTLVIATRNHHKTREIRAVLGDGLRYLTLNDLPGAPSVVEDADTFAGNAAKKADALARWLAGQPIAREGGALCVLADDSGLEVDALDGAPGVVSARFAALDSAPSANATDSDNTAKLLRLLRGVPTPNRTARFRCVIALATVGQARPLRLFEGACEGMILDEPRGAHGFGYDPVFQPLGHTESFAELGEPVKNRISHRARALAQAARGLEVP
ncbi:MAG TPA: non-canonical purine NTP pyrophosphatase [Candidatus Paceibacterota bacterium]|nr:non-canonical purine NTP pyrophosphatase [Candidatus Paceibacterota bacterium]